MIANLTALSESPNYTPADKGGVSLQLKVAHSNLDIDVLTLALVGIKGILS